MNEYQDLDFEQKMSNAMRRVSAPEDFAKTLFVAVEADERLVQQVPLEQKNKAKVLAFLKPMPWMSVAIAAALVMSVFMGDQVHKKHERVRAEQQFETATRITDQALEHTRQQLERAGVPLD
jgi:hypothetical protein